MEIYIWHRKRLGTDCLLPPTCQCQVLRPSTHDMSVAVLVEVAS